MIGEAIKTSTIIETPWGTSKKWQFLLESAALIKAWSLGTFSGWAKFITSMATLFLFILIPSSSNCSSSSFRGLAHVKYELTGPRREWCAGASFYSVCAWGWVRLLSRKWRSPLLPLKSWLTIMIQLTNFDLVDGIKQKPNVIRLCQLNLNSTFHHLSSFLTVCQSTPLSQACSQGSIVF